MAAAHLQCSCELPAWAGAATAPVEFTQGCTGLLQQTFREAMAAVARRGSGSPFQCGECGWWHTTYASRNPGPVFARERGP